VDSGFDEFFVSSPTYPSECVEVYSAPTETFHQANEVSAYQQQEFVEEKCEWTAVESAPNAHVLGAQQPQFGTQIPNHIMHDQSGDYFKQLAQSDFVDEIGRELPMWNDDPCFAKEVAAEGAPIMQEEAPDQAPFPTDIDLYEFIWSESF
jgi:hypothetical protein